MQILEAIYHDDRNCYSINIFWKIHNQPDDLKQMFLGDFASCEDYASENELHEQLEDINIYTPPVLPIGFVQKSSIILTLKIFLVKMRKILCL